MKKKYITLKPDMARVYAEGRKRMTRRVMRIKPPGDGYELSRCVSTTGSKFNLDKLHWIKRDGLNVIDSDERYFNCSYGGVGDEIVLGTTWAVPTGYDSMSPLQVVEDSKCYFSVRGKHVDVWSYFDGGKKTGGFGKLRPARFLPGFFRDRMPIGTLTVVRAERLQDITNEDAIAEGIFETPREPGFDCWSTHGMREYYPTPRDAFRALWDSINGDKPGRSFEDNPFVWVLGW